MTHSETPDLTPADEARSHLEPETADTAPDAGGPSTLLFVTPEAEPSRRSSFSLRKILSLPGWRRRTLAAVREELDEARRQLATLEQERINQLEDARRELTAAHAAETAELQAQADARLENTRLDADRALEVLAGELEARSSARLEAVAAELASVEAKAVKREEDLLAQIDSVRREARAAREAEVWALTSQAATQLEAARRDTEAALAAQATRLDAQAAADLEAAVRTFQGQAADALAGTVKQHNAAIAAVRAELADAEARRARLEKTLPAEVDKARREEKAAHAAQMAALEEQAAARLASTRRDTETALAILATQLEEQASAHLEATLREARDEAARAAAGTAQQHATALAAIRAQLEDVEARRARLEHDLRAQVDAARREAGAAHAAEVAALRTHAAAQVDTAVRDARDEAARELGDLAERHAAARATLRAERDEIEARRARLEQDLEVERALRREASLAHSTEVAGLQAQADARVEAAVQETWEEAAAAANVTAQQHAAALAAMRKEMDAVEARRAQLERDLPVHLEAARRDLRAAHAAEIAALRAQAAAQVEQAMRDVRDEAARAEADHARRHAAALAAVRHELEDADARCVRLEQDLAVQVVVRREAGIAHAVDIDALQTQAAAQVEAALARARDEATRAAADMAGRHALSLGAMRAELEDSEARRARLEHEFPVHLDAVRRDAEAAHTAAVAALRAQAAAQVEAAVREARDEAARAAAQAAAAHRASQREAAELFARTMNEHEEALTALRTELAAAEARQVRLEQTLAVQAALREETATPYLPGFAEVHVHAGGQARLERTQRVGRLEAEGFASSAALERRARVDGPRADDRATDVEDVIDLPDAHVIAATPHHSSAREMAIVTGALVLSGFAGSLVGLSVVLWAILS